MDYGSVIHPAGGRPWAVPQPSRRAPPSERVEAKLVFLERRVFLLIDSPAQNYDCPVEKNQEVQRSEVRLQPLTMQAAQDSKRKPTLSISDGEPSASIFIIYERR